MHLLDMRSAHRQTTRSGQKRYIPPETIDRVALSELLRRGGRAELESKQLDMLRRDETTTGKDIIIHFAGDLKVLDRPAVAIVGTREASDAGLQRANWLARKLAEAGVTIVSGLAKGVDRCAHDGAIDSGGKTAAVIGTPLTKAYPIEHAELQELIYREHLLISPFAAGNAVYKSNFPARNRVMAAVSDATVIIEASDTSGTLHQAAECTRKDRAMDWFAEWAADKLNALGKHRKVIVPVPSSKTTLISPPTFRTAEIAQRIAARSINTLPFPSLRFKNEMPNSRDEGGTRDANELYQETQLIANLPPGELILLDDVLTGGGHLQAAAWTLEDAGGKVDKALCCGRSLEEQLQDPFAVGNEALDLTRPADGIDWDDAVVWDDL